LILDICTKTMFLIVFFISQFIIIDFE